MEKEREGKKKDQGTLPNISHLSIDDVTDSSTLEWELGGGLEDFLDLEPFSGLDAKTQEELRWNDLLLLEDLPDHSSVSTSRPRSNTEVFISSNGRQSDIDRLRSRRDTKEDLQEDVQDFIRREREKLRILEEMRRKLQEEDSKESENEERPRLERRSTEKIIRRPESTNPSTGRRTQEKESFRGSYRERGRSLIGSEIARDLPQDVREGRKSPLDGNRRSIERNASLSGKRFDRIRNPSHRASIDIMDNVRNRSRSNTEFLVRRDPIVLVQEIRMERRKLIEDIKKMREEKKEGTLPVTPEQSKEERLLSIGRKLFPGNQMMTRITRDANISRGGRDDKARTSSSISTTRSRDRSSSMSVLTMPPELRERGKRLSLRKSEIESPRYLEEEEEPQGDAYTGMKKPTTPRQTRRDKSMERSVSLQNIIDQHKVKRKRHPGVETPVATRLDPERSQRDAKIEKILRRVTPSTPERP